MDMEVAMASVVVLGVQGEDGYWLVDFDAGTVVPLPAFEGDPFGYSAQARASGAVLTAGIDLAVKVVSRDDAFSGRFDG
jgi:hypothetical protein